MLSGAKTVSVIAANALRCASCLRTNCMRYLPNFFAKESMDKIFFCFPDPHFKTKNHRRRIVNDNLLTEYSYIMAPDALLYTITDVKELHDWHVEKCVNHPGFERVSDEECDKDPCVQSMLVKTEEGKKVVNLSQPVTVAIQSIVPW